MTRATETRLRASTPIGFLLSGGFDSSAIMLLANRAVADGRCHATLRSYSAVYERLREADERHYLHAVLDRCACVTPTLIDADDELWSLDTLDSIDGFELDEPPHTSRSSRSATGFPAVADGCRVLITGGSGDELLFRNPYKIGALFWGLSTPAMMREAPHFLKWPRAMLRSSVAAMSGNIRAWLQQRSDTVPQTVVSSILLPQQTAPLRMIRRGYASRLARWVGAETRRPFLDRQLVEFVMGLPPEYLFLRGRTKRLLREPLVDVLPPSFQERTTFSHATSQTMRGIVQDLPRIRKLLQTPILLDLGLATSHHVTGALRAIEQRDIQSINRVTALLATELWLRRESAGAFRET